MGKTRGGGVCLYINNRWCDNIKVHRKVCIPNLELVTLSLHPFYLPREFPIVVVSCVYVAPSANINIAAELIAEGANAMLAKYPGAPLFILGDFNSCRLDCYHHFNNMWIFQQEGETSWTYATGISRCFLCPFISTTRTC